MRSETGIMAARVRHDIGKKVALTLRRWRAWCCVMVFLTTSPSIYRRRFVMLVRNVLVLGSIYDGMGSRHRGGQALSRSVELGDSADLRQ